MSETITVTMPRPVEMSVAGKWLRLEFREHTDALGVFDALERYVYSAAPYHWLGAEADRDAA